MMGKPLNRFSLNEAESALFQKMIQSPVKILQIGEGNFLRGFFDWMIHQCMKQGLFHGSAAVIQPRPSGREKIEMLKRQDGLYTLVIRGIENSRIIEKREIISVFSHILDPYSDWSVFLSLAEQPELQFVVSNTTEAGLVYQPEVWEEGKAVTSFPGKLTAFLYRRYLHFRGAPEKGLVMLPCELVEKNGDLLKRCVLQYCREWKLPQSFIDWVEKHNWFFNTLVDRIVTGCPPAQSEEWFSQWGYEDPLAITAEPYHLWVIEGDPQWANVLPMAQAGLNVHWVVDLTPYQVRKVRILNGAHTLMTPVGILHGFHEVAEVMKHEELSRWVREAIEEEIIPTLPYDRKEMLEYANRVTERFLNPFLHHRLLDIALNSISKFKVRLLPSLEIFAAQQGRLPERIVRAFAALIRFYKVSRIGDNFFGKRLNGEEYAVQDEPHVLEYFQKQWSRYEARELSLEAFVREVLSQHQLWGKDLTELTGLADLLAGHLRELEGKET